MIPFHLDLPRTPRLPAPTLDEVVDAGRVPNRAGGEVHDRLREVRAPHQLVEALPTHLEPSRKLLGAGKLKEIGDGKLTVELLFGLALEVDNLRTKPSMISRGPE